MKKIKIYTDGACSGNPGPGGWGALLIYNDTTKELSGGLADTTNNQMELMGVIKALASLTEKCDIKLYSDSKYVVQGITEWIIKWEKNNWRGSTKKPVKNKELWQELLALTKKHTISFNWVKGHADNPYNNRCDELAVDAIETVR